MNLRRASRGLRRVAFAAARALLHVVPGGRISAFGAGEGRIGLVLIVNLDRQPGRLQRTLRELARFRTADRAPLTSIVRRLPAVDARDGRAVAATADVDRIYRLGDQLRVQPDARLEACFDVEEPVSMTRQEVAVARSHVEAWKCIHTGEAEHVLVLEDDIWFRRGAAAAIDRGWRAALARSTGHQGPRMLYLSYEDAGGTAEREEACNALFRPRRGLWFLSGYVLSRKGAEILLRAMPVVGPVDMWLNRRFEDLEALALSSPAILQRPDAGSDNQYSVLPFLARAGIVDADAGRVPSRAAAGPVLAWTASSDRDRLAMALSMLGLRVRVFDGDDQALDAKDLATAFETFDAAIDARLTPDAVSWAVARSGLVFVLEADAHPRCDIDPGLLTPSRTEILPDDPHGDAAWLPLCSLLRLEPPAEAFPVGPLRAWRMFRDDRIPARRATAGEIRPPAPMDETAWVLPPGGGWPSPPEQDSTLPPPGACLMATTMNNASPHFPGRAGTFPGNLAEFSDEGRFYGADGVRLTMTRAADGGRRYRSGAFASAREFGHGRFQAEIRAARGRGLVTGFFLHRDDPRQEIDIELPGDDPHGMLVNVYFNPGDNGSAMAFGYRGSPCRIDLGFDASADHHLYTIDWRPDRISWAVDGRIVHERVSWDPTPIPHLPMRLHGNLWAPRSGELAGRIDERELPSSAKLRSVAIWR